jgi:phosphoribosylanthranilate isomerase
MQVKICGIKTYEAALSAINAGADFIGFIFFDKSPRNINLSKAAEIKYLLNKRIKTVAVTVNAQENFIAEIVSVLNPDYIQFHGSENVEYISYLKRKFGIKIIKSVSVSEPLDLLKANKYKDVADFILFDSKPPKGSNLPGGNAVSFDWSILSNLNTNYKWFLSGGLNHNNIKMAKNITSAKFFDVSSGVEIASGVKSEFLINTFINNLKA